MDVIDGHNDLPWRLRVRDHDDKLALRAAFTGTALHTDLPRLRKGVIGAQFWSVYVPNDRPEPQAAIQVVEQAAVSRRIVARHPASLVMATGAAEAEQARAAARIACVFSREGGHCIDN